MVKVALVFPRFRYPTGDLPLGIAYIASSLLKNTSAEVRMIDTTFFKDFEEAENRFRDEMFDYVGISIMTPMIKDARKIISIARKYSPSAKIVVGGPHPTAMPEETFRMIDADAVVIGEGEEAFCEAINRGGFEGIRGVWYKENGSIIKNEPREPIQDLDSIPFPPWHLFDLKKYFEYWFQLDSVSFNLKGMNLMTSRGCPYRCSYCQPTLALVFGKKVRRRSVENVIAELKELKEKYGINAFNFDDDTFNVDKEWVKDLCRRMIEEKLNLTWGCLTRANLVDRELFAAMKEAGLRKVFFGVESASQRVLDEVFQKGITIAQVKNAVEVLNSLGLKVQCFFMLGAPTETREEINTTIRFARGLDIDEATFSITTPLPGTNLFNTSQKDISIPVEEFDYYKTYAFTNYTQKEMDKFKRKAFLSFYLSHKRLPYTLRMCLSPGGLRKGLTKLRRF